MCLFALTSSLKPAFLFLSFPGFREEPKIRPLPSKYFLNKTWKLFNIVEATQHENTSTIYKKRFYLLHHKLNLTKQRYKAETEIMRERLRDIPPA
jgi:hypothetical protein